MIFSIKFVINNTFIFFKTKKIFFNRKIKN